MDLKYIVTGTGRSGTVYMARLLTSLGLTCTHEAVFGYEGLQHAKDVLAGKKQPKMSWVSQSKFDKGVSIEIDPWLSDLSDIEAESSYMAAPYLGQPEFREIPVIHVVRNPIKVVNSFCHYIEYFETTSPKNGYEEFMYTHLPELKQHMPQYDRACLFWIRWNLMIESHRPVYRHRAEDDPLQLMEFLGRSGPHFSDTTINSYRKPTDGRFDIGKIVDDGIRSQFVELGKKYGYSMKSEYLMI